jgi:glutamate--cysteine ligase
MTTFSDRLAIFSNTAVAKSLQGIKHGIEREGLRITPTGSLAQTPHAKAIGSALTHGSITTDFSEALLEFITPPEMDAGKTMAQLNDIHKYVLSNMGDESLWPMSMPCYITNEDQIPIAQYGSSNVGLMKSLYRTGLKNRYGSMMQAIAGVHFNFSFAEEFWQQWIPLSEGTEANKDTISAAYFALIRNYRRFCWLIPYLFGASPALCSSFIKGKESTLPFKKLAKGSLYLPYATSLRMSDLGYTNSAQSNLSICYNRVDSYIHSLREAINTPSEVYKKFAGKRDGQLQQLNSNVLQIENELYSPIRPKQPTESLEKPTDALDRRGVSYIEVRALDVNPFSAVGIELEQFYFLDVFLLYCLVLPSAKMDNDSFHQTEVNLKAVVVQGRDPELRLSNGELKQSIPQWAENIFAGMREIALLLDKVNGNSLYSAAVEREWQKIVDPSLTFSARVLDLLLSKEVDNGTFGLQLAKTYKQQLLAQDYQLSNEQAFAKEAELSLLTQQQQEAEGQVPFEEFLQDYFTYPEFSSVDKDCA